MIVSQGTVSRQEPVDVADVDRLVLEVWVRIPANFPVFVQLEVEALVMLVAQRC